MFDLKLARLALRMLHLLLAQSLILAERLQESSNGALMHAACDLIQHGMKSVYFTYFEVLQVSCPSIYSSGIFGESSFKSIACC